jgi:hypothetical protein
MNSGPGLHPEPPTDFHTRTLPITTHGGSLFRSHLINRAPIMYFGRTGRNRFDDPSGRYAVLYAARDPFGAFIETFGQETGIRTIGVGELKMRGLTEFYPATPLSLVDLFGQGCLARIGADSRLFAGSRAIAQRWSRAIYEHPDRLKVHGILYPSRHNHTRSSVALFDREGLPRLEVNRTVSWYPPEGEMGSTLAAILSLYGFTIVETEMRPDKKNPGTAGKSAQYDLFDE